MKMDEVGDVQPTTHCFVWFAFLVLCLLWRGGGWPIFAIMQPTPLDICKLWPQLLLSVSGQIKKNFFFFFYLIIDKGFFFLIYLFFYEKVLTYDVCF